MEKGIEVEITYPDNEVKKALSFYLLRVRGLRTYALIVYPVLLAAAVLLFLSSLHVSVALSYLFLGCILYYAYYQRPIKGYLKFYEKRKGGTYRFEVDRVHSVGVEIQSDFSWSVFKKAYEIPSAFLLLDDNQFIYIFSKSCFNGEAEIEGLRDLLAVKIPGFKVYQ